MKKRSRPISRVLSWTVIRLRCASPHTCSDLPGDNAGHATSPYLALLRVGFTVPRRVATRAVRSYRTISPLPAPCGTSAVYFLWHFPWAHTPQALPGTLPYGARTFLHISEEIQRLSSRLLFIRYKLQVSNSKEKTDVFVLPPLVTRHFSYRPPIDRGYCASHR
jgi:hypothetical protein